MYVRSCNLNALFYKSNNSEESTEFDFGTKLAVGVFSFLLTKPVTISLEYLFKRTTAATKDHHNYSAPVVAARKAAKEAGASESDIHHAIRSGHPLGALAKIKDDYLEDTGRCPLKCRKLPAVSTVWSKLPKQCCGKKPEVTDPLQVRRVTRRLSLLEPVVCREVR
jgi:hypothetical protein